MTENRLESLDPELSARLETASIFQLRAAALAACRFVLKNTNLNHPILDRGLEALELGNYSDDSLSAKLESFVNYLDELQWDLQEKMDEGRTEISTYLAAFHQARAANSVYFALNTDALNAATESIYEAYAATEELATLKELALAATLSGNQMISASGDNTLKV